MHNTSGTSFVRMPVEILTKMHPTDGVVLRRRLDGAQQPPKDRAYL